MYKKIFCFAFAIFLLSIASSFAEEKTKMKKEEITYSIIVNKDFETVVSEVKDAMIDRNFKITKESEISKGMAERGIDMFRYKIIEFCNLTLCGDMLKKEPDMGAFMPTTIVVYAKGKQTVLVTKRMSAMLSAFENSKARQEVERIDKKVIEIMEAVK